MPFTVIPNLSQWDHHFWLKAHKRNKNISWVTTCLKKFIRSIIISLLSLQLSCNSFLTSTGLFNVLFHHHMNTAKIMFFQLCVCRSWQWGYRDWCWAGLCSVTQFPYWPWRISIGMIQQMHRNMCWQEKDGRDSTMGRKWSCEAVFTLHQQKKVHI